jgi:hypothetical protein
MSIIQISKIQVRTGNLIDLPQLSAGEFGWADDERRLFIGNDSNRVGDPDPNNTEILTKYSPIELSGNVTIANVENLHVGGGNNGYFLQTNGNGTLVWSAIPGGSTSNIAGSTGQIQFNTAGGFDASANLTFDKANSTLDVNGHIKSANLTVNTNSEFSNAIFTGNLRVSNTDQNTFVVFADANSIVSIGSGQVFANRLNANQANIAGNIISNTITANLFIRAASTLLVNDGSNSNIAGNLIVGNNNVWANSDGIALTGNLTAQGYISGESVTANSITINTSANINGVNLDSSTVTAANFTSNTGVFTGNGSGLSALNASNLSSGTIPSARLSGSYSIDVDDATTAGTVTTNAQPNITSVGTLTSLSVGDITSTGNLSAQNVIAANGANVIGALGVVGSGNISANLTVGGNITASGATFGNTVTATTFVGNVTTPTIIEGNSNVLIYSNGKIGITSYGQADVLSIQSDGTSANSTFANNVTVVGNLTAGSLHGPLSNGTSNVTVANDANIVLTVDGNNIANFTATTANVFGNLVVSSHVIAPNFVGALANGNSSVNIPAVNGNVNISAIGTPNVVVVANTGAIINGTLTANGNIVANNVNGGNLVTANFFSGVITTAAQPNITSIGTLADLNISNSMTVGANIDANVVIAANGLYGQLQTANQTVITQVGQLTNLTVGSGLIVSEFFPNGDFVTSNAVVSGSLTVGGNVLITNLNLDSGFTANGNITANYFLGNGSQLTGLNGPLFRAVNSVSQSLTTGTTNLIYAATTDNIGTYYNTVNGRFTPLVGGYYQINVSLLPQLVSGVASGSFSIALYKNGSLIAQGPTVAITPTLGLLGYSNLSTLLYLDGVSDYISIGAISSVISGTWQSTASVLNYFQAAWIRE